MPVDIGTLPPVTVYADPPNGDPYWGFGAVSPMIPDSNAPQMDPGLIAHNAMVNGEACFAAAARCDPQAMLHEFFKGLSGRTAGAVHAQLRTWAGYTDYLKSPVAQMTGTHFPYSPYLDISPHAGWYIWDASRGGIPPQTNNWYGNPLLPIKAIWHWINGGGQTVYMPVAALGLTINPEGIQGDFLPLMRFHRGPGVYPLDIPFSYNTFEPLLDNLWAAGTIGRISGRITGTITVTSSGQYTFTGRYTLNPDRYDADLSNRRFYQEALTDFLRFLGNHFGHTDYNIEFTGDAPLEFFGFVGSNPTRDRWTPTPTDPPIGGGKN